MEWHRDTFAKTQYHFVTFYYISHVFLPLDIWTFIAESDTCCLLFEATTNTNYSNLIIYIIYGCYATLNKIDSLVHLSVNNFIGIFQTFATYYLSPETLRLG